MTIITLTTDWGDDVYAAMAHGALLSALPEARVVDLSHHVTPFQTGEAAYLLRRSFRYFPEGTIHLLSVNGEGGTAAPWVAFRCEGHFFVGGDNGFAGLLSDHAPEEMVRIEKYNDASSPSFAMLSVFVPVAADLAAGLPLQSLGPVCTAPVLSRSLLPSLTSQAIQGRVIFIDNCRNAITNITRQDFERVRRGRDFEICVGSARHRIERISRHYAEVPNGELVALFNTDDCLEIAINRGFLSELLSITLQSPVLVKFYDGLT